jgi:hypothetical protein
MKTVGRYQVSHSVEEKRRLKGQLTFSEVVGDLKVETLIPFVVPCIHGNTPSIGASNKANHPAILDLAIDHTEIPYHSDLSA